MHAARGKDWETIAEEIIDDNVYAIERANKAAAKINATNPLAPVTWRDLIPLAMPAGTTMAMQDPNAVAVQESAAGSETEAATPTGEFAGITRQQWNRNRKAIKDVLDEMIARTTSEAAARVFLGGIGLSQASVDALIADAKDGTVETPEVIEGV
jgi:hypothetical protein